MNKNVLRKAVSMTGLFSFIYLTFSGVVMYITPAGRVAYWADWRMFGMNKTMYNETHVTVSLLFLVSMVLHIWLNWKPIINYMRSKSGTLIVFTRETVLGFMLSVLFISGTLGMVSPFSDILFFFEDVKDGYEESLGNPPYSHAELTTLAAFIKRMKFNERRALELLDGADIRYSMDETLKKIGENNGTDPASILKIMLPSKIEGTENQPVRIYEGVQDGIDMSKYENMMGSGVGKKSVANAAENAGVTLKKALERLAVYNIKAKSQSTLKDVGTEAGIMPMDVYIIIDSGVKPD